MKGLVVHCFFLQNTDPMDHYKVLEVSTTASREEIRAAYKRMAKMYHPDVNRSASAHRLFQHILESYRVLSDPALRAQYDASRVSRFAYKEYNPQSDRRTTHRRNPQSYRASPPVRQEDLIRPYMKYAYTFSWIGFALALLLAVDYFGPARIHDETISQVYILPGAPSGHDYGRPQLIYTEEGTRMEVRAGTETVVLTDGLAHVEKSFIFGFPRQITGQGGLSLAPMVLIYEHLAFFPLLLLVFSGIGAFVRKDIVFDFNVCLVSAVLAVITLVVIIATS